MLGAMLAQNTTLEVLHLSNCSLSNTREITPIIDALPRNTKLKKYVSLHFFSVLNISTFISSQTLKHIDRLYLDVNKFGKANLLAVSTPSYFTIT